MKLQDLQEARHHRSEPYVGWLQNYLLGNTPEAPPVPEWAIHKEDDQGRPMSYWGGYTNNADSLAKQLTAVFGEGRQKTHKWWKEEAEWEEDMTEEEADIGKFKTWSWVIKNPKTKHLAYFTVTKFFPNNNWPEYKRTSEYAGSGKDFFWVSPRHGLEGFKPIEWTGK